MKYFILITLLVLASAMYCVVMGYFTESFIESLRLVGLKAVRRLCEEESEMIYELTYQNGRKRKIRSLIGSKMQRELEKVAQ